MNGNYRRRRPLGLLPIFLFLILLAGGGCAPTGSGSQGKTEDSTAVLRVGVTPNAPPLIYRRNGEFTGLEADLARLLAARLGRTVRFVSLAWQDQIPALADGRTDIIMSGMSITELRKYRINFCDPYLVSGQVALVRRDELKRFSNGLSDLLNITVTVGTIKATTGSYLVEQRLPGNRKKEFPDPRQAVRALKDKRIDAFIYDLPMNFYFGALYETEGLVPVPVPLSREYLAWGVAGTNPELLAAANSFLREIKESGELRKLVHRWIPFYRNL